jgi:hypothetical protein
MYYQDLRRCIHTAFLVFNVILTCLLITQFVHGRFNESMMLACLLSNLLWMGWVASWFHQTMSLLFDPVDRFELEIPITLGIIASVIDLIGAHHPLTKLTAALLLVGWLLIVIMAVRERRKLIKSGSGLEDRDILACPDLELIKAFGQIMVLLTAAADIGKRIHEALCHAEIIVRKDWLPEGEEAILETTDDGRPILVGTLCCVTSFLPGPGNTGGVTIQTLERRIKQLRLSGEHYVVVKPLELIEPSRQKLISLAAYAMARRNREWVTRRQNRRDSVINRIPRFAHGAKEWLQKNFRASGYNYWCLVMGGRTENGWDCISIVVELIRRGSIKLNIFSNIFPNIPQRLCSDENWVKLTHGTAKELQQNSTHVKY